MADSLEEELLCLSAIFGDDNVSSNTTPNGGPRRISILGLCGGALSLRIRPSAAYVLGTGRVLQDPREDPEKFPEDPEREGREGREDGSLRVSFSGPEMPPERGVSLSAEGERAVAELERALREFASTDECALEGEPALFNLANKCEELGPPVAELLAAEKDESGESDGRPGDDAAAEGGNKDPKNPAHAAAEEEEEEEEGSDDYSAVDRQWLVFIGFYTKRIIRDFCRRGEACGCTGFLVPGKPAVACVEGNAGRGDIEAFIRAVRTKVFAEVPRASRKMTVSLRETGVRRVFAGFSEIGMSTSESDNANLRGAHKRKDMADLGQLEQFLGDRGLSHAFSHIFDAALSK
jgi:hypothetical protein